jgi:hypothetical protein
MKKASGKKNIDIVQDYLNGERPFVQVGYAGEKDKYIIRKLGETWTDSSGKEWVEKESGPQSTTRVMDIVRLETNDKCSGCKRELRWGNKLDRKMFFKTQKCFDCLVEEETQLKIKGKYKLYETRKLLENEISYLNDVRQKLKDGKKYLEENKIITFVNSNGLVEEWKNEARLELLEGIEKDFVTCLKKLKSAQKELTKTTNAINEVLATK